MATFFVSSDPGPRDEQEDACYASASILMIADGMGGHAGGALAAQTAVEAVFGELEEPVCEEDIEDAFAWASREVVTQGGGGTTFLLVSIDDDMAIVAWVGDSRAYLVRDGEAVQLTSDHVGKDGGLTRWIPDESAAEFVQVSLREGDRLILCTDGITDVLDEDEIANAALDDDDPAEWLVEQALAAGTSDNCTAIVYLVGSEMTQ